MGDETKMDEYFYKKYGRAPYTEDAYLEKGYIRK